MIYNVQDFGVDYAARGVAEPPRKMIGAHQDKIIKVDNKEFN